MFEASVIARSALSLLFVLFLVIPSLAAEGCSLCVVPLSEMEALLDFYDATGGDTWLDNSNWKNGGNPCCERMRWAGVGCTGMLTSVCHIADLHLPANNLVGSLPASIANLTRMESLELMYNVHLTGVIPTTITSLSDLTVLSLQFTSVEGPIPSNIGDLSKLQALNLSDNLKLDGSIPPTMSNLTRLLQLALDSTSVTGPLPENIGNMSSLRLLQLSNARLTGSIPESISLLHTLTYFDADYNFLNSSLPEGIFGLHQLEVLSLKGNQLSGSLPDFFNSTVLKKLTLSENRLNGNIPRSIANATALEYLDLGHNRLSGTIADDIVFCRNLNGLVLHYNQLSGNLPHSLAGLERLAVLDVASNQLTGSIPAQLAAGMKSSKVLNLSSNYLTGSIEFESLCGVSYLDLSNNRLEGTLPSVSSDNVQYEFEYLDLSHNELTGAIHVSFLDSLPKLEYLDLSHNNLNGDLADDLFIDLDGIQWIDISYNVQLTGQLPSELRRDALYQLRYLDASHCSFSGSFPSNYSILNQLQHVDVSSNTLSYKMVLPTELEHLSYFNISNNQITSFGDASIPWIYTLEVLDLSRNLIDELPLQIRNCCFYAMGTLILLDGNPIRCSKPPIWTECVNVVCVGPIWPVDIYYLCLLVGCAIALAVLTLAATLSSYSGPKRRFLVLLGVHSRTLESERRRRKVRRYSGIVLVVAAFFHIVLAFIYLLVGFGILLNDIERYCYTLTLPLTMLFAFVLSLTKDIAVLVLALKELRNALWWMWLNVWIVFPLLLYWIYPTTMTTGQLAFDLLPRACTFWLFPVETTMAACALLQFVLIEDGIIIWDDLEQKRRFEGEGDNGELIHCIYRNEEVILKRAKTMSDEDNDTILKEARVLAALKDHPNFPEFFGLTFHGGFTHIVMRYEERGNSYEYLQSVPRQIRLNHLLYIGKGVAQALQALHNEGIAHRDVTADNVLVHFDKLNRVVGILADLGNSVLCEWDWTGRYQAHALYEPPELIPALRDTIFPDGLPVTIDLRSADAFQFGICMWEMCTRERWLGCSDYHSSLMPGSTLYSLEDLALDIPHQLRPLFLQCCHMDRNQRPTALALSQWIRRLVQSGALVESSEYRVWADSQLSPRYIVQTEEYVASEPEREVGLPSMVIAAQRPEPSLLSSLNVQPAIELPMEIQSPRRPTVPDLSSAPALPSPYEDSSRATAAPSSCHAKKQVPRLDLPKAIEMHSVVGHYASSSAIFEEPQPASPPDLSSSESSEEEDEDGEGGLTPFIALGAEPPRTMSDAKAPLPALLDLNPYA